MRRSTKRAMSLIVAMTLLGSMGACGKSISGGENKIRFQTWNLKNDKFTPFFNKAIAQFEKENAKTKIEWVDQPADNYEDKLSTDAAAGTLPDVVDMGPEAAYALSQGKALLNVGKEDPSARKVYLDGAWKGATFKGNGVGEGTFGYPWYLNTGPTYVNSALMKRCGVNVEVLPKTYDGLFALSKTFGSACGGQVSLVSALPDIKDMGMYGIDVINSQRSEFTFNNKDGIRFIEGYTAMYKNKAVTTDAMSTTWSGAGDSFKQGQIALMDGSLYSIEDYKTNAKSIYDSLKAIPQITNGKSNMTMEMLTVNANSRNKKLAMKFARFITNKKNQLTFDKIGNIFPSAEGVIDDKFFNPTDNSLYSQAMRICAKQIKNGLIQSIPEFTAADNNYMREQLSNAIQGKLSVKSALDNTVQYSNKRLSDNAS